MTTSDATRSASARVASSSSRGAPSAELELPRRLERLGYERRRGERPKAPGQYSFGFDRFWIYRRPVRIGNKRVPARMIGLRPRRADGMIPEGLDENESRLRSRHLRLEPELLADSFDTNHGLRSLVTFSELPEHVWQPVLAAEDARFFEHSSRDAASDTRIEG